MPENQSENILAGVEVSIVGELTKLFNSLRQGRTEVQKTVKVWQGNFRDTVAEVGKLKNAAEGAMSGLRRIAVGLAAAFSAYKIGGFVKDVILLAARVDVLEVVAHQIGLTAGWSAERIDALKDSIRDMGITTRQSYGAITKFIQAGLDLTKASQLARVAQDAAVIGFMNSSDALDTLVNGISTLQVRVLRTLGIIIDLKQEYKKFAKEVGISVNQITGQQKQQIALNAVLEQGRRIQGAYETAMTKAGKQLTSLERYVEEFKVSMGMEFQDVFYKAIMWLNDFFKMAKENETFKRSVRGLANVLLEVFNVTTSLFMFLTKNIRTIEKVFVAAILIKFVRGLTLSISALYATRAAMDAAARSAALLKLSVTGIVVIGVTLGLLLSKRLPTAVNVLVASLGGLVILLNLVSKSFAAVWASMGPVGWAILVISTIASVVGLFASKIEDVATKTDNLVDQQKELAEKTKQTANEYYVLRSRALALIEEYQDLYKVGQNTADEQGRLHEILGALREIIPGLVTETDNLTKAQKDLTGAASFLRIELGILRAMKMEKELEDVKKQAEGVNKEFTNLVGTTLKLDFGKETTGLLITNMGEFSKVVKKAEEESQNFAQGLKTVWLNAQVLYSRLNEYKENPKLGLQAVNEAMKELHTSFGKTKQAIEGAMALTTDEKTRAGLQDYLDSLKPVMTSAVELTTLKKRVAEDTIEIARLYDEGLKAPEAAKKKAMPIDPEALAEANKLYTEYLAEMTKDEATAAVLRVGIWKAEQKAKIAELEARGVEVSDLRAALDESAEQKSIEVLKAANAERAKERLSEMRTETDIGLRSLKSYRKHLAARLSMLDRSNAEENKLWLQIALEIKKVDKEIVISAEEMARKRIRIWKETHKIEAAMLDSFIAAYDRAVITSLDMEMTGKERREAIWEDMKRAFVSNIAGRLKAALMANVLEVASEKGKSKSIIAEIGKQSMAIAGKVFKQIASIAANVYEWYTRIFGPFALPAAAVSIGGVIALLTRLLNRRMREGGYAGDGSPNEPRGVYEGGEYVINREATRRNRRILDMINAGFDIGDMLKRQHSNLIELSNLAVTPRGTLTRFGEDPFYSKRMKQTAEKIEQNTRQRKGVAVHVHLDKESLKKAVDEERYRSKMFET